LNRHFAPERAVGLDEVLTVVRELARLQGDLIGALDDVQADIRALHERVDALQPATAPAEPSVAMLGGRRDRAA
jgi:hypothetical protein